MNHCNSWPSRQQSHRGITLDEHMRLRTTYQLSTRQAKKLLISSRRLQIAIPVPPELPEDFDPLKIVRLALPHHYHFCKSAEYQMLLVQPPIPAIELGDLQHTKGTHGIFGQVITDGYESTSVRPMLVVACVVAILDPPSPQGPLGEIPIKWAGRIFYDGKEIAAGDSEEPGGQEGVE